MMVHTNRYGGCGGSRATYAAGSGSALELAVHEMGHSMGGVADEYAYQTGCGSNAGDVNTSLNGVVGAWGEWIGDLGSPREGAQYWQQCLFRPTDHCEMRNLFVPFRPGCVQHWSLVTYGHFRVSPTAPISSQTPVGAVNAWGGVAQEFVVGSGTTSHTQRFDEPGEYQLTVEIVADANFVKPSQNGANRPRLVLPRRRRQSAGRGPSRTIFRGRQTAERDSLSLERPPPTTVAIMTALMRQRVVPTDGRSR